MQFQEQRQRLLLPRHIQLRSERSAKISLERDSQRRIVQKYVPPKQYLGWSTSQSEGQKETQILKLSTGGFPQHLKWI